jgi:crossover junction endodeoxyribonuclease RuvC
MKLIVGIDAGLSGAWGMIDLHGKYWSLGDMHHDENGVLETERIWSEMAQARDGQDIVVVLEKVHSMPNQGLSSTFKFGMAFGGAIALAKRFNFGLVMVTPQEWKKSLKLSSSKDESLLMARELFPNAPLTLKKHNGRAEALLIAEFYRRKHER